MAKEELEERIQALEAKVQELALVVLSTGGAERAWQLATLGILGVVAGAPDVCSAIADMLERTRKGMVNDGVAQGHVEGFCTAGSLILQAINSRTAPSESRSDLH